MVLLMHRYHVPVQVIHSGQLHKEILQLLYIIFERWVTSAYQHMLPPPPLLEYKMMIKQLISEQVRIPSLQSLGITKGCQALGDTKI